MNKYHVRVLKIILTLFSLLPLPGWSLEVNVDYDWKGIFAGEITQYKIVVTSKKNSSVLLSWQLLLKGRTVSSGVQDVRFNSDANKVVNLPLRVPAMKSGIQLSSQLIISVVSGVNTEHKKSYQSMIPVYGPNLFLTDAAIYKQLNIKLFDPVGRTSSFLNESQIPYYELSREEIFTPSIDGLIVIGAGVDLNRYRGLIDVLIKLAEKGVKVLVLQPSSGNVSLLGFTVNNASHPSTLSFSKDSIVNSFAKGYQWVADDPLKKFGIVLRNHRQNILADIVEYQQNSWDWISMSFQHSGGRLIISMLPFIEHNDRGPIPQLLLGRLLMHVGNQERLLKQLTLKENKK
jgi:hypothetical protein